MAGKFEIYKDNAGEFRFRLKAGNGETLLSSEGYADRSGALNGIQSVQNNAAETARFQATETETGKFRFNLRAKNNQIIGTSQNYGSATARDNGIEAVGRAADGAAMVDKTQA